MFTLPFRSAFGAWPRWVPRLRPRLVLATSAVPPTLALRSGAVCRLRLRHGEQLAVSAGCVWLTAAGDPRDHLLWSGHTWAAAGRPWVVIEAVQGEASVRRLPAQRA